MFSTLLSTMLKTALVAGSLLLGVAVGGITPASASDEHISIDAAGFSVEFGERRRDRRHRGYRRRGHDNYGDHRDYRERRHYRRKRCTPRRAVRKARSNGLRRAHVVRIGRRGIIVAGRHLGGRVVVGFGRRRGCPVRFVRAD